jgi:hypothetical protein
MLVLAVLACMIYRMIVAARRRAEEVRSSVSDRLSAVTPKTDSEVSNKTSSSTSADLYEEKHLETMAVPSVLAVTNPDSVHSSIVEDLPYADPIDGMPFEFGEPVASCICGLAYREDSVKWLWEYHRGCCIHCGATVNSVRHS